MMNDVGACFGWRAADSASEGHTREDPQKFQTLRVCVVVNGSAHVFNIVDEADILFYLRNQEV